ncbi:MAG: TetR family transcriptional regulator [Luteitalea sp.]|nr:TetR family transcriptional regulator [Luteitalea sp.]
MPWPKNHKSRTRDRIVRAAAAAFRARGVSDVRVDDIMAGAGLTHGGFYAHFSSKDDLLGAALVRANCETIDTLAKALESIPAGQRLHAVIDTYLSPQHAAHPEKGCPVAALGPEIARASGKKRRDLARELRIRLDWLRGVVSNEGRDNVQEEHVVGAMACMVGGLILARVVDRNDSAALLEMCREFLHRALGETSHAAATRRPARRRRQRVPERRVS